MIEASTHKLIAIAGGYDLAFAACHLALPLALRWRSRLAKLDPVNRGVVKTLNLMLVLVFAGVGAALAFGPAAVASDQLGRGLLFAAAGFWLLRAALQPVMFGLGHWMSKALLFVFLAGAALHAAPAWP